MARNREKANLMFNRWSTMKDEMGSKVEMKERRPFLVSECKKLPDAERWRREVIRDITRKVAEIQNAGLGEARIRDLNDEINKLVNEKGSWERQIIKLGGPDYPKIAPKMFDAEGKEVAGSGGYRYYGAAKDLPGVRELLEAGAGEKRKRTRGDILRNLTPDYYGYRDEDDGVLVAAETAAEKELIAEAVAEFEARNAAAKRARLQEAGAAGSIAADVAATLTNLDAAHASDDEDLAEEASALSSAAFRAHVPLPSQQDIEALLLSKKKHMLLARLATAEVAAAKP